MGYRLAYRNMTRAEPDLLPGVPGKVDRHVTRLVAPNAGVLTGPGTNTYLVGERELAVIDPGPGDAAHVQAILAAGEGRIRWILCSHTHLDHASSAASLKKATGAKIAAMAKPGRAHASTPSVPAGGQIAPAPALGGGERDVKLVLDRPLADGDTVELDGCSLRAIHTPGHASNHLCFLLSETGMLFTGDHVMQGSTVVIEPPDGNMRAYLQSLRRLLALEMSVLAPGHGYLISQPHAEAERLIQHRLKRESKVRQALLEAGGNATLNTLLPRVYNDVPHTLHPIAARSLQAHLDKLVEDGEIRYVGGSYANVPALPGG
jgi:glyoxylase-like metal-dependent hydrolase (beta-lactamase superfamily II)